MCFVNWRFGSFVQYIMEASQFLCYERLLNMTYVAYKKCIFYEMQFWSHCYTVVSYQALFRLSVYKIPAVYHSGAKNVCFCTIRDFGSPTNSVCRRGQLRLTSEKKRNFTYNLILKDTKGSYCFVFKVRQYISSHKSRKNLFQKSG